MFEYERLQIQAPYVKVPPGALTALGSSTELRDMIEYYFVTVHGYFPIISKIRLYQHLANPLHEPGAGKSCSPLWYFSKVASTPLRGTFLSGLGPLSLTLRYLLLRVHYESSPLQTRTNLLTLFSFSSRYRAPIPGDEARMQRDTGGHATANATISGRQIFLSLR